MTADKVQAWATVVVMGILVVGIVAAWVMNFILRRRLDRARNTLTTEIRKTFAEREALALEEGKADAEKANSLDDRVKLLNELHDKLR